MSKKKMSLNVADLTGMNRARQGVSLNPALLSIVNGDGQDTASILRDLFAILPDPNQPRQLMTSDLVNRLWQGDTPQQVLGDWLVQAQSLEASPALRRAAHSLLGLADRIAENSLLHPIAVRPMDLLEERPEGITHMIVAGERRWWAHVYLYSQGRPILGQDSAEQIKAVDVPPELNIRVAQVVENTMRDDLNVWERAMALKAIKDELASLNGKSTWTEVEKMLGMDHVYRTRITNTLELSAEAINFIRWYDLTESAVRPVTEKLRQHPQLQTVALHKLAEWQEAGEGASNSRLTSFIEGLLKPRKSKTMPSNDEGVHMAHMMFRRLSGAVKVFRKLDKNGVRYLRETVNQDEKARLQLIELRDQLNQILG